MVGMQEMCHLMHDHIVKNPSWHLQQLMGDSNSAIGRSATSPFPFLVGNKFNGIHFELALKILIVKIIKTLFQIIIFIDLFLQPLFLDFLFHLLYKFSLLFTVHTQREIYYKSFSDHLGLNGLVSVRASDGLYFHNFT